MSERNYSVGLDLARVLAVYLVIVYHGVQQFVGLQDNYAGRFMLATSICCVDLFGLISGWLGVTSTAFKPMKIVKLWIQVVFTGSVITFLWSVCCGPVTLKDVGKALIPITAHEYWYFTAYVPLFFLMPILNAGFRAIPRNVIGVVCGALFFLVVVLPYFNPYKSDAYVLGAGYSPIWLLLLYLFGASLRILIGDDNKNRRFLLYGSLMLALASSSLSMYLRLSMFSRIGYCAPTVLTTAIGILIACANVKWRGLRLRFFSSCAFGVYLWHVHPLMFGHLHGAFAFVCELPVWLYVTTILVGALCVYLVACGLEVVRVMIFNFVWRGLKHFDIMPR